MRRFVVRAMLAASAASPLLPARAAAQSARPLEIQVGAVRGWSGSDQLGDPPGVEALLRIPMWERATLVLGAEWLQGVRDETGVPCAGLVRPGTCNAEPVAVRGSLFTVGLGVAASVVRWPRAALDFSLGVRAGDVGTSTRGKVSAQRISGSETVFGADVGLELSVVPRAAWPVSLYAGVRGGALATPFSERVMDGYTPFEGGFGLARVHAGLAWTLPRRGGR